MPRLPPSRVALPAQGSPGPRERAPAYQSSQGQQERPYAIAGCATKRMYGFGERQPSG
jgi:hypothetical protein